MLQTHFFPTFIYQDHFLVLLSVLHFENNNTANLADPHHKIRNVLGRFTRAFRRVFVPHSPLISLSWLGKKDFHYANKSHQSPTDFESSSLFYVTVRWDMNRT